MSLALGRQAMRVLENRMSRPPRTLAPNKLSLAEETPIDAMTRQAATLLKDLGVDLRSMTPIHQRRTPWTLLAVAHLKPGEPWSAARSWG